MIETSERTVQVGDFFEESWGYDQTNVDFYQVVRVSASGKSLWMRHVQCSVVRGGDGGPADYIAPLPDAFDECGRQRGDLIQKRILFSKWDGENRPYLNMTSYSNAYLWDLKPAYQTGANWGH